MQTWKDNEGRQWTANCSIGVALQLKNQGTDLLNPDKLAAIYADPIDFLKLGVKLHSQQMTELGVADLDMLELMTSSAEIAEASSRAIEAALNDFFLRVRGGKAMSAVLSRAIEAAEKTEAAQVAMIRGPRADQAIARMVQQATKPLNDKLDQLGLPESPGEVSGPAPESSG